MPLAEIIASILVGETGLPGPCDDVPAFLNEPENVNISFYSGSKIRVTWTNVETDSVLYGTRVYRNDVLIVTLPAPDDGYDTGYTSGLFKVSHYNDFGVCGELESIKVSADM